MDMVMLREALEASWDSKTSYLNVGEQDNPALGQCYPTARVVQILFPATEIVEGKVWTGKSIEKHFWNVLKVDESLYPIDFTWQQFPHGSIISSYKIRDRKTLGDSQKTLERVKLLHERVMTHLTNK